MEVLLHYDTILHTDYPPLKALDSFDDFLQNASTIQFETDTFLKKMLKIVHFQKDPRIQKRILSIIHNITSKRENTQTINVTTTLLVLIQNCDSYSTWEGSLWTLSGLIDNDFQVLESLIKIGGFKKILQSSVNKMDSDKTNDCLFFLLSLICSRWKIFERADLEIMFTIMSEQFFSTNLFQSSMICHTLSDIYPEYTKHFLDLHSAESVLDQVLELIFKEKSIETTGAGLRFLHELMYPNRFNEKFSKVFVCDYDGMKIISCIFTKVFPFLKNSEFFILYSKELFGICCFLTTSCENIDLMIENNIFFHLRDYSRESFFIILVACSIAEEYQFVYFIENEIINHTFFQEVFSIVNQYQKENDILKKTIKSLNCIFEICRSKFPSHFDKFRVFMKDMNILSTIKKILFMGENHYCKCILDSTMDLTILLENRFKYLPTNTAE